MIHQDLAHGPSRQRQEMLTIDWARRIGSRQLEPRLMHQCRGLQGVPHHFAAQQSAGYLAQLGIQPRKEFLGIAVWWIGSGGLVSHGVG
jgi:hypothetical protein